MSEPTTAGAAMTLGVSQVASVSRRDAVVTALRDAILSRRLQPGERLPEVQLAKDLGVSRPTLKYAVSQLTHEGLLVHEAYKGITVATVSTEQIHDIARVRIELEALAATSIADKIHTDAVRPVLDALSAYEAVAGRVDASTENDAHLAFHEAIWLASGSAMLQRLWPIVSTPISLALSTEMAEEPGDPQHRINMHRSLVAAIQVGDPAAIEAEVRHHIEDSARRLIERLSSAQHDAR